MVTLHGSSTDPVAYSIAQKQLYASHYFLSGIVKQLKQEHDRIAQQLAGINTAIAAFSGLSARSKPGRKPGTMSAAGRARIAAAQRKRWAKVKAKAKKGS
jgi:hypothetical protein